MNPPFFNFFTMIASLLHRFIKFTCILILLVHTSHAQDRPVNLMPLPAQMEWNDGSFLIQKDFSISLQGSYHKRLEQEATRFLRRLDNRTGRFFHQHLVKGEKSRASMVIAVARPGKVQLHEDESYELTVSSGRILLKANSDIGAIRGLETLLQLTSSSKDGYYFPELTISDKPRFAWRGIMLDVARHFMPMDVVLRNLDAMAAVKLNVLHLHLSDDQGFRFESTNFPQLTSLGSDGLFYTREDLKKIIDYADQRGIRVIPEIDVPGHATAILVAYPELGSKDTTYVLQRNSGIFDPTLDPSEDEVYRFLETLFAELAAIFPDPFFHIGGDENLGKHWDSNPGIQQFMSAKGLATNHELQAYFNIRLQKILEEYGKRTMGWEEIMTPDMPRTALIHSWKGEWEGVPAKKSLYQAAKAGYETILSNGYYLDLMFSAASHYQVDPAPSDAPLTPEERKRILGGEMCMWSELVVPATIDSRLWPRAAAVAERLWSPERIMDVKEMFRRLDVISLQLEEHGLTHIKNREMMMRNLVKGREVEPLRVLANVAEPLEGYTRNPAGTMYSVFSPYTLFADIALADAPDALVFSELVGAYMKDRDTLAKQDIICWLELWKKNHAALTAALMEKAPALQEIESLSEHLSQAAIIGLAVLTEEQTAEFYISARATLKEARAQGGRTELAVIDPIEKLLDIHDKTGIGALR